MVDRFFGNSQCALDDQFRLHVQNYTLYPCRRISVADVLIGVVDNNTLNPRRLMVLDKDREKITVFNPRNGKESILEYPGKSAFIYNDGCKCKIDILGTIGRNTGIKPDRRDHLYVARVDEIESADWQVWWAPLQLRGLSMHCRIISLSTIN